jgi:hypothetical protein
VHACDREIIAGRVAKARAALSEVGGAGMSAGVGAGAGNDDDDDDEVVEVDAAACARK